jgi:hypothetical protein
MGHYDDMQLMDIKDAGINENVSLEVWGRTQSVS